MWNALNRLAKTIVRAGTYHTALDQSIPPPLRSYVPDHLFQQIGMPRPRVFAAIDLRVFNILYTYAPLDYIYSVWQDLQRIGREAAEWIRTARERCYEIGAQSRWRWSLITGTVREHLCFTEQERQRQVFDTRMEQHRSDIRDPRIPVHAPPARPDMMHLLEQTLRQLDLENEEPNATEYSFSEGSSDYSYQSDDEILFRPGQTESSRSDGDSSMTDSTSFCTISSESRCSSPMQIDDRMVLHPLHSAYAQKYPSYNVFCGQPLINNGYINVPQAIQSEAGPSSKA